MSFNELDDWLEVIESDPVAAELPIALIATKSDLEEERAIPIHYGELKKKEISAQGKKYNSLQSIQGK